MYVSASKRAVLDTLGLPAEYEALLTTDDRARLHAVPLWRVSLKHMARTLKHYRGRYTTIVGFQPTGWSMHSGDSCPSSSWCMVSCKNGLSKCSARCKEVGVWELDLIQSQDR